MLYFYRQYYLVLSFSLVIYGVWAGGAIEQDKRVRFRFILLQIHILYQSVFKAEPIMPKT